MATQAQKKATLQRFGQTGTHLLAGAAGMYAGMALIPTRYSFWSGLAMMAYGTWKQKPLLVTTGMGVAMAMPADMAMTGGQNFRTMAPDPNQTPAQRYIDGVKAQTGMFFQGLARKMSLDIAKQAMGKSKTEPAEEDLGALLGLGGLAADPVAALDELNERMAASALALQESNPIYLDEPYEAPMEALEADYPVFEDLENPDLDQLEARPMGGFDLDDF